MEATVTAFTADFQASAHKSMCLSIIGQMFYFNGDVHVFLTV
jgi:hypothetical protein